MFFYIEVIKTGLKVGGIIAAGGGALLGIIKQGKQMIGLAEQAGAVRGAEMAWEYAAENGCPRCAKK